ncbi:matrixin family metalloprotease [Nitrosopumilus maritimus]|uniref:Peptidase M10A and M12B matrixin and adamalysin n=1 Tax=Nitrosopumilus maritimus (strain SCM1) TaxID=436308 RepID=A9A4B3_NITMS|nr:matrixin family metalloprotease [Nitrosopumilus maritimus]ABX12602.1 peptidase M10A and M12B matrixin and adamalysin [Nitrosopumilus maritimus SCM1]
MVANTFAKKDYINALDEIENQQFQLLQRKAKFLQNELTKTSSQINDFEIDSLNDLTHDSSFKNNKKHNQNSLKLNFDTKIISIKHLVLFASFVFFSIMTPFLINTYFLHDDIVADAVVLESPMKTKFLIENLRGDTIDTVKSWRILDGDALNVNLINGDILTSEQHNAVLKVINSTDSILIDDHIINRGPPGSESIYFLGWAGAMEEAAKTDTAYTVPTTFNIFQSENGEGQIIINFSNLIDTDGFTGYTKSVIQDGEILKSYITIYDVDNLDASELATIVRHEFGHALGLGHSTDPEDLMAPTILTEFPYISECNVDAMRVLYNGHESGMAVCKK